MKRFSFFIFLFISLLVQVHAQEPWKRPLMYCWSDDGISFNTPALFQDSAGVPSVIQWKGDTLIAAFQWFRLPNPSATWDRVATRMSYDNGQNWTQAQPIIISGMPPSFQRAFDPTLALLRNDSLRIYFSSSRNMPLPGADSVIDTYSAVSADGIHFMFEPGARVNEPFQRVIDPAVIHFNNAWHYLSPAGAPQDGAFHYIGPDGLRFSKVPMIYSDSLHNWTGNYMQVNDTLLRFYGSGPKLWYNSSRNGGVWNGYVSTNISGGDPAVVKVNTGKFLMIFTGMQKSLGIENNLSEPSLSVYPNPANESLNINFGKTDKEHDPLIIYDALGRIMSTQNIKPEIRVNTADWENGIYYICIPSQIPVRILIQH